MSFRFNYCLALLVALVTLCALGELKTLQASTGRNAFIGTWIDRRTQTYIYVKSEEGNRVSAELGYSGRSQVWGRWTGIVSGRQLLGSWESPVDGTHGPLRIELKQPPQQYGYVTWKYHDSRNERDGTYRIDRVSSNVSSPAKELSKARDRRNELINNALLNAHQNQHSDEQWFQALRDLKSQIHREGIWHPGWTLPPQLPEMWLTDHQLSQLENKYSRAFSPYVSDTVTTPESCRNYHRFYHPLSRPKLGARRLPSTVQDDLQRLEKRIDTTGHMLERFKTMDDVHIAYAIWNRQTVNQSSGVIARTIGHGTSTLSTALYNNSHQPIRGEYQLNVKDGDRLVATGNGDVGIPAYGEVIVPLETVSIPYCVDFFRTELTFTPEGYEVRPIPSEISPFWNVEEQYCQRLDTEQVAIDFLDAMYWGRVREAWDANDIQLYARSVREAGGKLYFNASAHHATPEQLAQIKTLIREQLEPLERAAGYFDRPRPASILSGEKKIKPLAGVGPGYFKAGQLQDEVRRKELVKVTSVDSESEFPDQIAMWDPAQLPRPTEDNAFTFNVWLKGNRFHSSLSEKWKFFMIGWIELYDGPVPLGAFPLEGRNHRDLEFADEEVTLTFYERHPSFRVELKCYQTDFIEPSTGTSNILDGFNIYEKMNRVVPGLPLEF